MKPLLVLGVVVSFSSVCHAGPTERAIMAAMKLSEQPNYSWITTVTDDARAYDIDGKTEVGGATWVRLPMVKAIARRLGRDAESDIEAVFKGSTTCVIRTGSGWKTLKELPRRKRDWDDDGIELWPAPMNTGYYGRGARGALDPMAPPLILPAPSMALNDSDDDRCYSNAQFAVSHPHEELAVIVSSYTELNADGDTVTGTLSDLGARLLLVRDGQEQIKPLRAAGVFTLQLKGGMVARYSLRLEGVLLVEGRKFLVHQTSQTTVKNVGTTQFEVPEEARRKLGL